MDDRLIPLLAIASFTALGWTAGFAYGWLSTAGGTLLGLGIGLAYAAWYWRSNY
jgi:hypothetical protein